MGSSLVEPEATETAPGLTDPGPRSPVRPGRWWAALVGLAALGVYLRTLAPSIFWGDSPELTTAAYFAGVPHPTGYPLYMLLAHPFVRYFPLASPAFRMNLLSALAAALAVTLAFGLCRRFTRHPLPAALAALLFAFGRTFWSQAVIAEVYAFHLLLVTAVLLLVLAWDHHGDRRLLWAAAGVYGLGFTHHLMSVLLLPGLLLFVLAGRRRGEFLRELPRTMPLFLLPLALYLYLPLAALRDSPANWGDPRNWGNFVEHVTGWQYQARMFRQSPAELWRQAVRFGGWAHQGGNPGWFWIQYGTVLPALALVGIWSLARRQWRLLALSGLVWLAVVGYGFNYAIDDVEVYYLPAHLITAVWMGCGIRHVLAWMRLGWRRVVAEPARRERLTWVTGAGLLVLPYSLLSMNWAPNDQRSEWGPLVMARATLDAMGPGAVVIGGLDNALFPVTYCRYVEGRRPDIVLYPVFDLLVPQRLRLATRFDRPELLLTVPDCYRRAPRGIHYHNCLLDQLLKEQVRQRPVYVLGLSEDMLLRPWMRHVVAPYFRTTTTNVPLIEVTRTAPPLVPRGAPRFAHRVAFGRRLAGGRVARDLELQGYDIEPFSRGGLPWWRLRYYWRVLNPAVARRAQVRALFADAAGTYETDGDGTSDLQNFHPLGYGFARGQRRVDPELCETFELYVPPRGWNAQNYLWMGVVVDGDFLACDGAPRPFVRLGELPPTAGPARLVGR